MDSITTIRKDLFNYAYNNNVPLIATIEIISGCNFHCVHCYIENESCQQMLSFGQIEQFGNQIIEKGCLYVSLTGGEVMLHPDFIRIYSFFAMRGVCVSVLSNGSLINDEVITLFKRFPPKSVEITMYGYTDEVYKRVTGNSSCENVKRVISRLKNSGINVLVKMFVTKENRCDLSLVAQFAKGLSLPFKCDAIIIADRFSGKKNHELPENEILDLFGRFSFAEERRKHEEWYTRMHPELDDAFLCGAGRVSCWLKSNYHLRMCNFLDNSDVDLNCNSFDEAWGWYKTITHRKLPETSKCRMCENRVFCSYCPALSSVINNDPQMLSSRRIFCDIALVRKCTEQMPDENTPKEKKHKS